MRNGASARKKRSGLSSGRESKRSLIKTLEGHTGGINCVDYSSKSKVILTGSDDRTARVWDMKSFSCKLVLEGHTGYVTCCKIFGHKFAVTSSFDCSIRKWNIATGNCVMKLDNHSQKINEIIFFKNLLFSASYDKSVTCCDLLAGDVINTFRGHVSSVSCLVYLPIDQREDDENKTFDLETTDDVIITGSTDETVKIWEVRTSKCKATLRGHHGSVTCLSLDTQRRVLYSGSRDKSVIKWDLQVGRLLQTFKGPTDTITRLQLSGKLLFAASLDRSVCCWVTDYGDVIRRYKEHAHMISDMQIYRGTLLTGCGAGHIRIFDIKSGLLRKVLKGHLFAVNAILVCDVIDKIKEVDDVIYAGA